MRKWRRNAVDWLLEPQQRELRFQEPGVCQTFGDFALDQLRACSEATRAALLREAKVDRLDTGAEALSVIGSASSLRGPHPRSEEA